VEIVEVFANADYKNTGSVPRAYIHELLGLTAETHPAVEELRCMLRSGGISLSHEELIESLEDWIRGGPQSPAEGQEVEEDRGRQRSALIRAREIEMEKRRELEELKRGGGGGGGGGVAGVAPGGRLVVTVREARGLVNKDWFGFESDPYCTVLIGEESFQTQTVRDNTNPSWNESFSFLLPADPSHQTLSVNLYDDDSHHFLGSSGDRNTLGTVLIPLSELLLEGGTMDKSWNVACGDHANKSWKGDIYLRLEWKPEELQDTPALQHQHGAGGEAKSGSSPSPPQARPAPVVTASLPQQPTFTADSGSCIGMDIGGSLAKLVFFESDDEPASEALVNYVKGSHSYGSTGKREAELEVGNEKMGGKLHFISFSTERMTSAVQMIKVNNLHHYVGRMLHATGGGAHKYKDLFEAELGLTFVPQDELGTVIQGMAYLVDNVPGQCYTMRVGSDSPQSDSLHLVRSPSLAPLRQEPLSVTSVGELFPFLLCNIGTGVSIVRVNSVTEFKRVSGTALGGGTFLGLCRLLTQAKSFDDAMDLADVGDSNRVNMLVSDIYGGDLKKFGLPGDFTASFFAKNLMDSARCPREGLTDSDIAKSLCTMIAQNVTQIAHLNARLHGIKRVFFTGNFLRHNDTAGRTIVQQMGRWNKLAAADTMPSEKAAEQVNAYFFRHEGFFGSVGALIRNKVSRIESPRLGPTNDVESKTPPALDLDLGKTATPLSRSPGSRPFAGYKAT